MTAPFAAAIGLGVGAVIVTAVVPVAIRLARKLRFYDRPAGYKQHSQVTPYLGGLAVLVAFLGATLATGTVDQHYLPLVLAAVVVWAVGTMDDRRNLSPWLRVLCEVGLGLWLSSAGLGWHL